MRVVTLAGKAVQLYDSIEELPIVRFHKYNKMLLIDANIGSDLMDADKHIEKAMIYARSDTPKKAITELENLRQNLYFIQQNISPKCLAFAVLVKSINGKPCNDMSDEGLAEVVRQFNEEAYTKLTSLIEDVKKKIDDELRLYFPSLFDDATAKSYYDELKKRTLLVLQGIIKGEDTKRDVEKVTDKMITYYAPKEFGEKSNFEIEYDRQYENMCLVISQNLHANAKTFSVLEYYNAYEYIQRQQKELEKQRKR